MNCRLYLVAFCILLFPLAVLADGGVLKGFSQQLSETHQLAVINLSETASSTGVNLPREG